MKQLTSQQTQAVHGGGWLLSSGILLASAGFAYVAQHSTEHRLMILGANPLDEQVRFEIASARNYGFLAAHFVLSLALNF